MRSRRIRSVDRSSGAHKVPLFLFLLFLLAFLAAPCEPGGQRIQSRRSDINNRQCPAFSSRWIPAGPSLEHRQELAASLMACACARPQPSGSYSSGLAECDDREAMCLGERTGEGEKWKSLLTRARRRAPSSPGLGVSLATCQWAAAPRAPAVKLPISVEARSTSLPVKKKKKKGQGEAVKGWCRIKHCVHFAFWLPSPAVETEPPQTLPQTEVAFCVAVSCTFIFFCFI